MAEWVCPELGTDAPREPARRSFFGLAFAIAAAIIIALVLMYPSASANLPGRVESNRAGAAAW